MIDAYIERTCGALRERFAGAKSVSISQLGPVLPADALAWCKADAMEQLATEWSTQGPTSRILIGASENARVVRGALSSLIPFFTYEASLVPAVARRAMQFASGYAIHPRMTLTDQVFRGAPVVKHALLTIRLSAATEYQYLPSLLLRALRGYDEITRAQFATSTASIDDAALDQHDPDEFARLMTPILRWSAIAGGDPQTVPVPALLEFLADKCLEVLYNYIASIARIRSRTDFRLEEIAALVRDIEVNDIGVTRAAPSVPPTVEQSEVASPPPSAAPEPIPEEAEPIADVPLEPQTTEPPLSSSQGTTPIEPTLSEGTIETEEPVTGEPVPEPSAELSETIAQETAPAETALPEESLESGELAVAAPTPELPSEPAPTIVQEAIPIEPVPHEESTEAEDSAVASAISEEPAEESPTANQESVEAEQVPPEEPHEPAVPIAAIPEPEHIPEPPPLLIREALAHEPAQPFQRPAAEPPAPVPSPVTPPSLPPRRFAPELRTSLSNSLFHGNVAYFDVTVNELSRMDTWREAANYLTDLLDINRLNPYAPDVMQFTDAIRRWFIPDDEDPAS